MKTLKSILSEKITLWVRLWALALGSESTLKGGLWGSGQFTFEGQKIASFAQ